MKKTVIPHKKKYSKIYTFLVLTLWGFDIAFGPGNPAVKIFY